MRRSGYMDKDGKRITKRQAMAETNPIASIVLAIDNEKPRTIGEMRWATRCGALLSAFDDTRAIAASALASTAPAAEALTACMAERDEALRQNAICDAALERASHYSAAAHFLEEHDAYSWLASDAGYVAWQTGGKANGVAGGPWAMSTGRASSYFNAIICAATSLGWKP